MNYRIQPITCTESCGGGLKEDYLRSFALVFVKWHAIIFRSAMSKWKACWLVMNHNWDGASG